MRYVILPVLLLAALAAGADVGVDSIVLPDTVVDSGYVGDGRLAIANYSDVDARGVRVVWQYSDSGGIIMRDSVSLPQLPPYSRDTIEFTLWWVGSGDTITVVSWTVFDEDTNPSNDTAIKKVFVRVRDIGLTDLWPAGDTFDSGEVIVPHVRAWNYGNVTTSFALWSDSITLPAGGSTVVYGDSMTCMPGVWTIEAYAIVQGDLHPGNNRLVDTFYVRGTIEHRVGVRVFGPDTVDSLTPADFGVVVTNLTGNTEAFWMYFLAADSARTRYLYHESLQVMVGGRDSLESTFPPLRFPGAGRYFVACSLSLPGGNDTVDYHYFWVVPGSGVEESGQPTAYSLQPTATIIRDVLVLPRDMTEIRSGISDRVPRPVLLDATGRKVMTLHAGARCGSSSYDVSRLAPGVYFVHEGSGARGRGSGKMRKVLITR